MRTRIPVAVLGATGSVGQRFVQLLDGHPWFEVVGVTGSDRSEGQIYGETCHWVLGEPMPEHARSLRVLPSDPEALNVPLAFSALPSEKAREIEPRFAQAGVMVCSNASAYRKAEDVPILLPEVNPGHAALVPIQRQKRGWKGGIVTNPNCTSTGMTVALKPLVDAVGVKRLFVVSMQALSGAGYPGVASLDIIDNVIPYIEGEEEKVEWEPRKMLGALSQDSIEPAGFIISAQTNRVAVSDGHVVCCAVELNEPLDAAEVARLMERYAAPEASRDLPSAPHPVIVLRGEPDRPQPRLDRMEGRGMATIVGRLRPDPIFHVRFVVLSHNTIRGAAGGSVYNAELLVAQGMI
jgi:aspartate-semialdehyde dehydrogenase